MRNGNKDNVVNAKQIEFLRIDIEVQYFRKRDEDVVSEDRNCEPIPFIINIVAFESFFIYQAACHTKCDDGQLKLFARIGENNTNAAEYSSI